MKTKLRLVPRVLLALVSLMLFTATPLKAQTFLSYPAGDDVTVSLGQFQLVLDPAWVRIFDDLIPNSPLGSIMSTRHTRLYHHGVFTSPTLYDPSTIIGRSDSFLSGGPQETLGSIAGHAPGRTFIRDAQLTVLPTWLDTSLGVPKIHTFLKSMHLTDSISTRIGFSVRAGMLAPTRPVSAGEVRAGSDFGDFPAQSFFNVYVQIDLPSGGLLPPIQLVNVEPLLVEQTNISSFPPRIIYQHGNSTAVSMYFNSDVIMPDPSGGPDIPVPRGTLFGQLTLAGHGAGFGQTEVEAFQAEFENEMTNSMPVNPTPIEIVQIQDFAPDYNATPPTLLGIQILPDGAVSFTVTHVPPNTTNYIQFRTNPGAGTWQTIGVLVPPTNSFTFTDRDAASSTQRFYRWTAIP